jgi:hypothetical protein
MNATWAFFRGDMAGNVNLRNRRSICPGLPVRLTLGDLFRGTAATSGFELLHAVKIRTTGSFGGRVQHVENARLSIQNSLYLRQDSQPLHWNAQSGWNSRPALNPARDWRGTRVLTCAPTSVGELFVIKSLKSVSGAIRIHDFHGCAKVQRF